MATAGSSRRRRSRFTAWTLIAPVALAGVVLTTLHSLARDHDAKPKHSSTAAKTHSEPAARHRFVRLRDDDTLSSLAEREGVSIEAIYDLNPTITDPLSVHPGQVIRVRK